VPRAYVLSFCDAALRSAYVRRLTEGASGRLPDDTKNSPYVIPPAYGRPPTFGRRAGPGALQNADASGRSALSLSLFPAAEQHKLGFGSLPMARVRVRVGTLPTARVQGRRTARARIDNSENLGLLPTLQCEAPRNAPGPRVLSHRTRARAKV